MQQGSKRLHGAISITILTDPYGMKKALLEYIQEGFRIRFVVDLSSQTYFTANSFFTVCDVNDVDTIGSLFYIKYISLSCIH